MQKIGLYLNIVREKVILHKKKKRYIVSEKGQAAKKSDQKLSTIKNVPNMTKYQCLSALTMYVKTKVLYEISCIYLTNHKVRFRLLKKDYMCSECGEICFDC